MRLVNKIIVCACVFSDEQFEILGCEYCSTNENKLSTFLWQGSIYTLCGTDDGFASGGKDGCVRLWDSDFKPITRMDLAQSSEGYQGNFL